MEAFLALCVTNLRLRRNGIWDDETYQRWPLPGAFFASDLPLRTVPWVLTIEDGTRNGENSSEVFDALSLNLSIRLNAGLARFEVRIVYLEIH